MDIVLNHNRDLKLQNFHQFQYKISTKCFTEKKCTVKYGNKDLKLKASIRICCFVHAQNRHTVEQRRGH